MGKSNEPSSIWPVVLPAGALLILFLLWLAIQSIRARFWENAPPPAAPPGMVWIPGGTFLMGTDDPRFPDSGPVHKVTVGGFWMDKTEVTNADFEKFADATRYVTVAEKPMAGPNGGLPPGSFVFVPGRRVEGREHPVASWFKFVEGADWRHPEGPGSTWKGGRENHPVVHVCYDDAAAYTAWAGKRLPTEAEWEFAARGGLEGRKFPWGDELKPNGKWMANVWQGEFPKMNTMDDGFLTTAPVGSFPPNAYGLYDMAGNVWEWCADWYRPDYFASSPAQNPKGPNSSLDPDEPGVPKRIQRGGSFLCDENVCARYFLGSRMKGDTGSAANHIGFRCVKDAK
jgi:formylglycine-generating enzyme required for sulfatase activity